MTPHKPPMGAKLSLYLPIEMSQHLRTESKRTGRPISWLLRYAWNLSKERVAQLPREFELQEGR